MRKVFYKLSGWPLFRDCATLSRCNCGLSGIGGRSNCSFEMWGI